MINIVFVGLTCNIQINNLVESTDFRMTGMQLLCEQIFLANCIGENLWSFVTTSVNPKWWIGIILCEMSCVFQFVICDVTYCRDYMPCQLWMIFAYACVFFSGHCFFQYNAWISLDLYCTLSQSVSQLDFSTCQKPVVQSLNEPLRSKTVIFQKLK